MRLSSVPLRPQLQSASLAAAFNGSALVRSLAVSAQQVRKRVVAGAAVANAQKTQEDAGKSFRALGLSEEVSNAVSISLDSSVGLVTFAAATI